MRTRAERVRSRFVHTAMVVSAALIAAMLNSGAANAATVPTPPTNAAACPSPTTPPPPTPPPASTPGIPELTSLGRTPSSINVTNRSKSVSFTVRAKDVTNDITGVLVTLQSPLAHGHQRTSQAALRLTSGTAKNGVWRGSAVIPRWTNSGTWTISRVLLHEASYSYGGGREDPDFGVATYTPRGGAHQLPFKKGWPKTFKVTSEPDATAPTITSVTLSSSSVDTSKVAKTILVTATATDALSGIRSIVVRGFAPGHSAYTSVGTLIRTSGSARKGTYKGSIVVPAWVGDGRHAWSLDVSARDRIGNVWWHYPLHAADLTWRFSVTSRTDKTRPALLGLSFDPSSVDASQGDAQMVVTVEASDLVSGVADVGVSVQGPSFGGSAVSQTSTREPGGAWKVTLAIPRCSEPGTWSVWYVGITDVAGNGMSYYTNQLEAMHVPATFSVKALDVAPPFGHVPLKVPHAGPVTVTFSEPTLWAGSVNPFTVTDLSSYTAVTGVWTCRDVNGATVGCNADGADVTTASFQPTNPFVVDRYYGVYGSGIYDTSGNGPSHVDVAVQAT